MPTTKKQRGFVGAAYRRKKEGKSEAGDPKMGLKQFRAYLKKHGEKRKREHLD